MITRPPDSHQAPQTEGGEPVEDSPEALRAEIAALRLRLVELERRLDEREGGVEHVRRHGRVVPYQELFEKLPIPTIVFRADGVLFAINKANCELIRVTPDALVGGYNMLQDPEAIAKGYVADFERAVRGEVVTMPPTSYDTASAGIERLEDRTIWSHAPARGGRASGACRHP